MNLEQIGTVKTETNSLAHNFCRVSEIQKQQCSGISSLGTHSILALGNKRPFHAGSMNLEQTGTVKTETNSLSNNFCWWAQICENQLWSWLDWNLPGIFYDPGIFREFDNFSWSYDRDPGIFREFDDFSRSYDRDPGIWRFFLTFLFPGPEGVPEIPLASSKGEWALESPHFLGTLAAISVLGLMVRQPLTWGFSSLWLIRPGNGGCGWTQSMMVRGLDCFDLFSYYH